jgi:hypothetical protein
LPKLRSVGSKAAPLLTLRSAHLELQTGIEQNLFADADTFAIVRATADGCFSPDHSNITYFAL